MEEKLVEKRPTDTAFCIAFMLAAVSFFDTFLLASRIVGSGRQLWALDHLIHVAAATFHRRLLVAWRACTEMAFADALMRIVRLAAGQSFLAIRCTQWDRIRATCSLVFINLRFSTWTRLDNIRQQLTVVTLASMAQFLALVISTFELLIAHLTTRIIQRFLILFGARNRSLFTAAIASLFDLLRTFITIARMARLFALVNRTIKISSALLITLEFDFLIALVHFLRFTAATCSRYHNLVLVWKWYKDKMVNRHAFFLVWKWKKRMEIN